MDRLLLDLRYALRALRAAPLFTAVGILSIALGIGANTTVFTFVNAIFFAPLPFRDATRLFDVYEHNPQAVCAGCGVGTSYTTYQDLRTRARSFERLGAYNYQTMLLSDGQEPGRVRAASVSGGLLDLLGATPERGRLFQADDDRVGADRIALIGVALWHGKFRSDPGIIGRSIRLDGDEYTIVGVLARQFRFPDNAQVWIPLAPSVREGRGERTISVIGRLADGATPGSAAAELGAIGRSLELQFPQTNAGWSLHLATLRQSLAGDYQPAWVALALVGFVLLVACANLAGLLLARAALRRRELGVRLSLGATRQQLVWQLLTESLVLAFAGGTLGILGALWGVDFSKTLAGDGLPLWSNLHVDYRVLLFATALTLLTGVGFGLIPALEAARVDLASFLKESAQAITQGRRAARLRRLLVAGEIACAMLLLTGAGLTSKTFLRARTPRPAYDPRGLMRAEVRLTGSRYQDPALSARAVSDILARTAAISGVRSAAANALFIVDWPEAAERGVQVEGVSDELANQVVHHAPTVSPNFFATLGLPTIAGRVFNDRDVLGAPGVALVNEELARRLWPGVPVVGKRVRIGRSTSAPWLTIVGVVANGERNPLARDGLPALLYLPIAQQPIPRPADQPIVLFARTTDGTINFARDLTAAISAVDAQLAPENIGTAQQSMESGIKELRFVALLFLGLAGVAISLALMGVYGISAFAAVRRSREIGIRLALGATRHDAVGLVLREALGTALIGVGLGIIAALFLTGVLRQLLFNVSPTDPTVFTIVTAALGFAALAASYLPARRVLRVDPAATLRAE